MDLTIYDIIKGPVVTEKARDLNNRKQQLVLKVSLHANKPLVKQAIELLFNVKVDSVRIYIRKGKKRRVSGTRLTTVGKRDKRAIVSLAEGYDLKSLVGESGTMSSEGSSQ
jgi:large subunit ribosomal protein L23